MAHDIFVSYSSTDKPTADAVCASLEASGIRCWIAPRDILPGTTWGGSIIRAIGESRVMVLVFSSDANGSQQVLREVERAVNKGIVVVPFRIENVRPSDDMEYYLSAPHWLDAITPPLQAHLQRLCQTVQTLLPSLAVGGQSTAAPAWPAPPDLARQGQKSIAVPPTTDDPPATARAANRAVAQLARTAEGDELAGKTSAVFNGAQAGQVRDDNGLATKLVWIPAGRFLMGSPETEVDREANERQVEVTFNEGFWLGQCPVTQREWLRVMRTTPWRGRVDVREGEDYPATFVRWDDAIEFCKRLTENERYSERLPAAWDYTLPTEAQFEYACRAKTPTRFSFGDDDAELDKHAWFKRNATGLNEPYAHRVGQLKPNPWAIYDLHGNVWEWCRDFYLDDLPGGNEPENNSEGSFRVYRGGSWDDPAKSCRSAYRGRSNPARSNDCIGFRIALVRSCV